MTHTFLPYTLLCASMQESAVIVPVVQLGQDCLTLYIPAWAPQDIVDAMLAELRHAHAMDAHAIRVTEVPRSCLGGDWRDHMPYTEDG